MAGQSCHVSQIKEMSMSKAPLDILLRKLSQDEVSVCVNEEEFLTADVRHLLVLVTESLSKPQITTLDTVTCVVLRATFLQTVLSVRKIKNHRRKSKDFLFTFTFN